jgi:predicted small integral membrane protein
MHTVLTAIVLTLALFTPPLAAQQASAPEAVVAEVRRATARYLDIANARADGYVQASGMEARHGYHFVLPSAQARALATGTLDLTRPPVLLYVEREGVWQLAGVEYALPSAPAMSPLPASAWHRHEASCHYRDFREIAAASARRCPARHPHSGEIFVAWHPELATAHVWAWYPNPDGPFAEANAFLGPYGGFTAPEHHGRNPAELVYSQFTHRIAGAILLMLAGLTVWESWRPRSFPWNAVSAPLWIAFGVYLIPSSDPESWPYGPQRFVEIFDDPLVLQHKLLALLPIAIGVIVLLRGLGRLPARRLARVLAGVAVAGGLTLFFHFHDGRIHFDTIYLQHALMGTTAIGVGVALLVGTRTTIPSRWLTWAWPTFLGIMALVLLLYRES